MQKNNSNSSSIGTSRILIADDNEPNRELLEVYLADVDWKLRQQLMVLTPWKK